MHFEGVDHPGGPSMSSESSDMSAAAWHEPATGRDGLKRDSWIVHVKVKG